MKVLFLQEFIRENHMKKQGDSFNNVFMSTEGGKILRNLVESKAGLNLSKQEYYIDYAYSLVPQVITRDKYDRAIRYKPPTQKEASAEYKYLFSRIVREKPDIIIPTGNIGCRALLGQSAITSLRGVPEKVTIESERLNQEDYEQAHTQFTSNINRLEEEMDSFVNAYEPDNIANNSELTKEYNNIIESINTQQDNIKKLEDQTGKESHTAWVLPMFSMEYMLVNPNIQNLVEADFVTLNKFVLEGESAFISTPTDYEFANTIEKVRDIFHNKTKEAPIVAWDLETNTLRSELKGAKPLVISISTKEEEGYTIPLEHKEFTWKPEELEEIYKMVREFVADPNIIKVGHNIQFDIKFLRLTKGFDDFKNNRDTMVMYYLLINQGLSTSLKLSDMSYELTDMGGYDKGLEEFKKEYIAKHIEAGKLEVARLRAEENVDYKVRVANEKDLAKQEGRKVNKIEKIKFTAPSAPRNEIDGSDFNYEWIPLKEMLHPYASGDVDACLRIHNKLDAMGKKHEKIRKLYTGHYPDLVNYLAKIESNGITMDMDYNQVLIDEYGNEIERLLEIIREVPIIKELEADHRELYEAGLAEWAVPKKDRDLEKAKLRDRYKNKLIFNPSPNAPDKAKVLYDMMGIVLPFNREYLKDSAVDDGVLEEDVHWTHYKADKSALEYISEHIKEGKELADLLLTYSLVTTRRQNFTYKLREMVSDEFRIHGRFNSTGTATGRLSSSGPNLQQLPRTTGDPTRFDYKYPIKRMFISRFEGGALLQMDYSALESRVLAIDSKDAVMAQGFMDGVDPHTETAMSTWKLEREDVTGDIRNLAKAINFGVAFNRALNW